LCADCRAAQLQALQQPTNYYQQTPLQQTGFYQAQQTGSSLQVLTSYLYHHHHHHLFAKKTA